MATVFVSSADMKLGGQHLSRSFFNFNLVLCCIAFVQLLVAIVTLKKAPVTPPSAMEAARRLASASTSGQYLVRRRMKTS